MLYLFDLDGTLIESYMDNPDRAYNTWQPLPGRAEKIAYLRNFAEVAVITNQAGVAFGHITEQDVIRKPGGAMIREAIAAHPGMAEDGVLFVGDRPEDQAAAQAASVPFMWSAAFFGDDHATE